MESLIIQFYVTVELRSPVFGRPSWAYHLEAQAKRKKKKRKEKTKTFFSPAF